MDAKGKVHRIKLAGSRLQGIRFRVQGLRVEVLGCWIRALDGNSVWGSGFPAFAVV